MNLRTLIFAVAVPVTALAQAGSDLPLSALEKLPTLGARIAQLDRFVHERYYDADGLMYSHINWREERPFAAADFSPRDSTIMGPEPHQWMSYENSVFVSGLFLAAQCLRYEATRDPEALDYARKAFGSIDRNYRLSEEHDPASVGPNQRAGIVDTPVAGKGATGGFFCKPYYGKATDHTSTEQHFEAIYGLYHYWRIAPEEVKPRIKQMFSEVSRRWRAGYRINFFGEVWNLEESYPRAQRHMFTWAVIHRLAHEVTGEPECLDEFKRLDSLYGAVPTPRETMMGLGRPSYISTEDRSFHVQIVLGADLLTRLEPKHRDRYRRGMRAWWDYSTLGQREDLLSYYFVRIDALTGGWETLPVSIKHRAHWRSTFMMHNATLPICWLGTRERQGISSAILMRQFPDDAAAPHARLHAVFADVRKEHFKWFADPEGVMPPEMQWMLNVLQGDSLAFHSLGYWYARVHGIEL